METTVTMDRRSLMSMALLGAFQFDSHSLQVGNQNVHFSLAFNQFAGTSDFFIKAFEILE